MSAKTKELADKLRIILMQLKANLPTVITRTPYAAAVIFILGVVAGAYVF